MSIPEDLHEERRKQLYPYINLPINPWIWGLILLTAGVFYGGLYFLFCN